MPAPCPPHALSAASGPVQCAEDNVKQPPWVTGAACFNFYPGLRDTIPQGESVHRDTATSQSLGQVSVPVQTQSCLPHLKKGSLPARVPPLLWFTCQLLPQNVRESGWRARTLSTFRVVLALPCGVCSYKGQSPGGHPAAHSSSRPLTDPEPPVKPAANALNCTAWSLRDLT